MKKITILLAFMLFAAISTKATIWTVSNDPNQPARWTNLQTACDSANAGDTIYVQGSPTDYGSVHIKKRLHIIGVGIKPETNFLYGYSTYVSSITFDTITFISGSSGSILEGLKIGSISSFSGCENLIIRRNRIDGWIYMNSNNSNIMITNNILQYINASTSNNILIMNNIFRGYISSAGTSVIISNNLFINSQAFSSCSGTTITNNIFYYASVTGATFSNFSNNMGFGISSNVLQGSNTGSGNFSADPKFVYKYTGNAYNDLDNYNLLSSSPGKNAGTDVTDIGIFGGQYPFPKSVLNDYAHCITPLIPVMQQLIIQNSSVPANGNLNFSVKGYKTTKN